VSCLADSDSAFTPGPGEVPCLAVFCLHPWDQCCVLSCCMLPTPLDPVLCSVLLILILPSLLGRVRCPVLLFSAYTPGTSVASCLAVCCLHPWTLCCVLSCCVLSTSLGRVLCPVCCVLPTPQGRVLCPVLLCAVYIPGPCVVSCLAVCYLHPWAVCCVYYYAEQGGCHVVWL
jgi:hypothetical protein